MSSVSSPRASTLIGVKRAEGDIERVAVTDVDLARVALVVEVDRRIGLLVDDVDVVAGVRDTVTEPGVALTPDTGAEAVLARQMDIRPTSRFGDGQEVDDSRGARGYWVAARSTSAPGALRMRNRRCTPECRRWRGGRNHRRPSCCRNRPKLPVCTGSRGAPPKPIGKSSVCSKALIDMFAPPTRSGSMWK